MAAATLYLLLLLPCCAIRPAVADLLTTADVPPVALGQLVRKVDSTYAVNEKTGRVEMQDDLSNHQAFAATPWPLLQQVHSWALAIVVIVLAVVTWNYAIASGNSRGMVVLRAAGLGVFYIALSTTMIESNKWLMHSSRFPYPFTLTAMHMSMSFKLANIVRFFHPQAFPAFETLQITKGYCLKFLALGVPFACSIVCGNWAYKYVSVAFLQIMKESNIVTIFFFSVLAGIEVFRGHAVALLGLIFFGAAMGVHGEMHFVWMGFLLQVCSSFSECAKIIVQSFLMSGESKLDPMSLVFFMAPACFLSVLGPLYYFEGHELGEIGGRVRELWPYLTVNASLAFVLNATVAQCIKQLSSIGFLLCGIVKDIAIIIVSTWYMGESLTHLQQLGFTMALSGVASYTLYKQNLECFDEGLRQGFYQVYKKLSIDHRVL